MICHFHISHSTPCNGQKKIIKNDSYANFGGKQGVLWAKQKLANLLNPFAPGDFAEKPVLKLVEWFSGHCRAIKSQNLPKTYLPVVHFTAFLSRCKISACEVRACTESKIST